MGKMAFIKQYSKKEEYFKKEEISKISFYQSIILWYRKIFSIILKKEYQDSLLFFIPEFKPKREEKVVAKLIKNLEKENITSVILSKKLEQEENFRNILNAKGYTILDGRMLFRSLSADVLEYIAKQQDKKLEMQEVVLLVNEDTSINRQLIIELSKRVKNIKIITNHIEQFKKLGENLYHSDGIMIGITNNKQKGLKKAKIILNIDFPEELVNLYTINREAILINLPGKILIRKKGFNGIYIHDLKIRFNNELDEKYEQNNVIEEFRKELLLEKLIYDKKNYQEIQKSLKEVNTKIENLIGNNGIISREEYQRVEKMEQNNRKR